MDLDKYCKARGTIKSKLTAFSKYLSRITTEGGDVGVELILRLERAEPLLDQFEEVQGEIEQLIDQSMFEHEISYREDFENEYFSAIAIARGLAPAISTPVQEIVTTTGNVPAEYSNQLSIKLPTVHLTQFRGNYEEWLNFHDSFNSMIIQNPSINDIQRFHYLKSAITGSAEKVIDSISVSADNFQVAWKLLCERFENKPLLIHNHIKAIFNLPNVVRESSASLHQLIDNLSSSLRSLKSLGEPVEHWNSILLFMLIQKLDSDLARDWESHKSSDPTTNEFIIFLKSKADIYEKLEVSQTPLKVKYNAPKAKFVSKSLLSGELKISCIICKSNHRVPKCPNFLKLSIKDRFDNVKKMHLCTNCLHEGHSHHNCKYGKCHKCGMKHHTLLHIDTSRDTQGINNNSNEGVQSSVSCSALCSRTLLSTVMLQVRNKHGKIRTCRALLDSGSQSNFISLSLCDELGVDKEQVEISVVGITQIASAVKYKCTVQIKSVASAFSTSLSCLVVSNICGQIPGVSFDSSSLQIPSNITLADPNFNVPSDIDLLIGAPLFWELICVGQIKLGSNLPVLQKTKFGWLVSGPLNDHSSQTSQVVRCNFTQEIPSDQLSRFWEVEECVVAKPYSKDENYCEEHFKSTHLRNSEGRFVLTIPLKNSAQDLGESKTLAMKRFLTLERKLSANPSYKEMYKQFMDEYISLGHMSKVSEDDLSRFSTQYYLPHHGVIKEDSLTTKLRVVFDGSFPTSTGLSVNHIQMTGPTIQDDLLSILIRFRQHSYVVSADITKMYRQVLISPSQRPLQLVLWRSNPSDTLDTYALNTVTYGTTSASFMATRCLLQLSYDSALQFPQASEIIKRDFYVDDLLTGADSIPQLSIFVTQIDQILRNGCFPLRKWVSNEPSVLDAIADSTFPSEVLTLGPHENNKTLGLHWSYSEDHLMFRINCNFATSTTKRSILSCISQIFDPLGLLSATIIKAKILIQRIWLEKIDWDQSVPLQIQTEWLEFRDQLSDLCHLRLPRHAILQNATSVQLHCFCDASEAAYGACIYIRSVNEDGDICVRLLCAKGKVAPLKKLTVPRLELCGALLLSRLLKRVTDSLTINVNTFLWCDSTIVLAWLKTSPNQLKTFVANRVVEIQSNTEIDNWRHVSTGDNPADLLSRGVNPALINSASLWWQGPPFLKDLPERWPVFALPNVSNLPEIKQISNSMVVMKVQHFSFERFSSFCRLTRCMAYCLRFINNLLSDREERTLNSLSVQELKNATIRLCILVQRESFASELISFQQLRPISEKSKILSLNPFLGDDGLIRVGGRLRNSNFDYNKKHPILLPSNHSFTNLLFKYTHVLLCHAGPQLLLATVREEYWPILGRSIAKKTVRECVRCFRVKPANVNPLMGDLPAPRVQLSLPFTSTGVDYAGPFTLKSKKGRGFTTYKAYICLFVCLTVKAIHLELVTDLTTASFLACLKRFIARRGKPAQIFSDNGTNFVGANNELTALGNFLKQSQVDISDACVVHDINWKFIPAHSPHFGGIWESGVKSMKSHLKRVLTNAFLTYEDFVTVLTQVECILNSRPLTPLSSDPADLNPISPSHFLIGRSMMSIPEPDLSSFNSTRLDLYQRLQQLRQHFWDRWALEYISELQQRQKWKMNQANIKLHTMVVIKDKNLSPLHWLLGRVEELHPGADDVVRVVSIRTTKGLIRRAVSTVCPLPGQEVK